MPARATGLLPSSRCSVAGAGRAEASGRALLAVSLVRRLAPGALLALERARSVEKRRERGGQEQWGASVAFGECNQRRVRHPTRRHNANAAALFALRPVSWDGPFADRPHRRAWRFHGRRMALRCKASSIARASCRPCHLRSEQGRYAGERPPPECAFGNPRCCIVSWVRERDARGSRVSLIMRSRRAALRDNRRRGDPLTFRTRWQRPPVIPLSVQAASGLTRTRVYRRGWGSP